MVQKRVLSMFWEEFVRENVFWTLTKLMLVLKIFLTLFFTSWKNFYVLKNVLEKKWNSSEGSVKK
jgi:hypothetical protein